MKSKILKLWKQGRNVWEISQVLSISEQTVYKVINEI